MKLHRLGPSEHNQELNGPSKKAVRSRTPNTQTTAKDWPTQIKPLSKNQTQEQHWVATSMASTSRGSPALLWESLPEEKNSYDRDNRDTFLPEEEMCWSSRPTPPPLLWKQKHNHGHDWPPAEERQLAREIWTRMPDVRLVADNRKTNPFRELFSLYRKNGALNSTIFSWTSMGSVSNLAHKYKSTGSSLTQPLAQDTRSQNPLILSWE